jgi:hypothetical protein
MNPSTANNELRRPPKIQFPHLALEAVGMVSVAVILVGLFG